jgi:exoribonuclease R
MCSLLYLGREFRAVFITTVRSRHVGKKSGDDLGFLSEPKLVNTALTRAKSYVAVIGDPVALCNVGECSAIWRHYIKHCRKVGSVVPDTLTSEHADVQYQEINGQYLTVDGIGISSHQQPDDIIRELENVNIHQSLFDFIEEDDDVAYVKPGADAYLTDPPQDDIIDGQLQELIHSEPDKYKICVLHVVRAESAYAVPKSEVHYRRIYINGRQNRGRSYGGDEVVIEVLPTANNNETNGRTFGRVVGIHRRALQLRNRVFLCHPCISKRCGLMIPLNSGAPIMKCLLKHEDRYKVRARKDVVCVYKKNENQPSLVTVDMFNPQLHLFKVRYVTWKKGCYNPLGQVIDVIHPVNSKEYSSMPKVSSVARVDDRMKSEFKQAIKSLRQKYNLDEDDTEDDNLSNDKCRIPRWPEAEDYRNKLVFTIDHRNSVHRNDATFADLDDAVSEEQLEGNRLLVSIHIADVSSAIPAGSSIDTEARFARLHNVQRRLSSDDN